MTDLPICLIAGTNPPRFLWRQVVDTPIGQRIIEHEGTMPPTCEAAIVRLIDLTKQLIIDNEKLREINQGFADRIAAQSELLSKRAEGSQNNAQPPPPKQRRGV